MAPLQKLALATSLGWNAFALAHPSPSGDSTTLSPQSSDTTPTGRIPPQLVSSASPTPDRISDAPLPAEASSPLISTIPLPTSIATMRNNFEPSATASEIVIISPSAQSSHRLHVVISDPRYFWAATKTAVTGLYPTSIQSDRRAENKAPAQGSTDAPGGPSTATATPTETTSSYSVPIEKLIPDVKTTEHDLFQTTSTAPVMANGASPTQTNTPASPGTDDGSRTSHGTSNQTLFSPQTKTTVPMTLSAVTKTTVQIAPSAATKTTESALTVITLPASANTKTIPDMSSAVTKTSETTEPSDAYRATHKTSAINLENPNDVASAGFLPIPAGMGSPPSAATSLPELSSGPIVMSIGGTYVTAGGPITVIQGTTYSLDASARTAFVNGVASSVTPSQLSVMATTDGRTTYVPMASATNLPSPSSAPSTTSSPSTTSTSSGSPLASGASSGRLSPPVLSWASLLLCLLGAIRSDLLFGI